jgi:hypothetical protein
MSIMLKSSPNFIPAPAGTHAAVCVDVIDLGMIEVVYQGKTQRKPKIVIVWQIAEEMESGAPFLVRRRYTASLHEKATLRRDLESWRGRPFTDVELQGFEGESLIGVGCLINVIHESRNGSTFANVASVMRLPKGMTPPTPRDYVRVVDRPPSQKEVVDDGASAVDDEVPF